MTIIDKNSFSLSNAEDLRSKVKQLALSSANVSYHYPSRTHIVYVEWLKPYKGGKGYGYFAYIAWDDFTINISRYINNANINTLKFWLECYEGLYG